MTGPGTLPETVRSAPQRASAKLARLVARIERDVLGRRRQVELALIGVLSEGHLLIEDLPGTGKTTLARALAESLGLTFRRMQCTADMLPSDVTGGAVLDPVRGDLAFRPGPVFTHVVLADELNRAPPRAQSALLECMNERRVTVDGTTHDLPRPFLVIATQSPPEAVGAHPLPESQLDRFLLRIRMGRPTRDDEREILRARRDTPSGPPEPPALEPAELRSLLALAAEVRVHPEIENYLLDLLDATRGGGAFLAGLSPRAGAGLLRAAQARALLDGRDYVVPSDVKHLAVPVLAHRVVPSPAASGGRSPDALVADLIETIPVPA